MKNDLRSPERPDGGFTLIEMMIVAAIIGIMAAVAIPAIANYSRNYKIRGAAREVAGGIQAARGKAIMTNANLGVSFVVLDFDTYRFVQEDMIADVAAGTLPAGSHLSPIRELPQGIRFVVTTAGNSGPTVRFDRLGTFCNPAAGGRCRPAVATPYTPAELAARCTTDCGARFLAPDAAGGLAGGMVLTLREETTGQTRTVSLAPGGRILAQP